MIDNRMKFVFNVLLIAIVSFSCSTKKNEKYAFIEIRKVIESFKLKKDLESSLLKVKESRENIIDSLEFELRIMARTIQAKEAKNKNEINEFQIKKENYFNVKGRLENEVDSLSHVFDIQILSQINQYVKDYGEKNNYECSCASEGSGAIMYGDSTRNITEAVIAYINDRFNGKNK